MSEKSIRPDWVPVGSGNEFTTEIKKGINPKNLKQRTPYKKIKRNVFAPSDYSEGVRNGDLSLLARAITLVESSSTKHILIAQEILKELSPFTGNSIRIGITGPPGAGKSTFIDTFGCFLCNLGHKVAVLAVDPSSSISHGSILGDKTRMENLSKRPEAFIRPSASGGSLGGVARKTRETALICEAAGYDIIIIETIGVGQSEITVRSMVDFFLLILLPGSGDELQGIKKGAVELADLLVVNKAEGDNFSKANITKEAYKQALHYIISPTQDWITKVLTCSALTGDGIPDIWNSIEEFVLSQNKNSNFTKRRNAQTIEWIFAMIEENLKDSFYKNPNIIKLIPIIKDKVLAAELTPVLACQQLLSNYFK